MEAPDSRAIYHILHVDRLHSVVTDRYLRCDALMSRRPAAGTCIGMSHIKSRRLQKTLATHPDLRVGDCVPFYFCPRSVMLYVIFRQNNPSLTYSGGQDEIVHLEADLSDTVRWAKGVGQRWVFTLSNAGAYYFEERDDLACLNEIDWDAIQARDWRECKEAKQAEFLVERKFPWSLIRRVGVKTEQVLQRATDAVLCSQHQPPVETIPDWYY